ncbi:hypothetical protein [Corynebacterium diphtheriae]|uniref:hypothetical protein n=1 Tax=Corynebacterium diphtheriae TaxID=1717 RepID=UPI000A6FBE62|nr:hypothetical protein [Corynebacterium diphtheriae]UWE88793.1 hypothetical protein NY054_04325 [Corynebacterium diphtheriae bv. mitis]
MPQESGSSVGDFIAGILAIVTGALTPMSIGTTANTSSKTTACRTSDSPHRPSSVVWPTPLVNVDKRNFTAPNNYNTEVATYAG